MCSGGRHVRKAAVQSLSTVAHHKPRLLAGQLPPLLPKLYAQTAVDESLIRVVDLGPFKHRIDDGLELRKVTSERYQVDSSSQPPVGLVRKAGCQPTVHTLRESSL